MRDSWGSLLIKVSRSANRLYKAQLKVGKEGTNEMGRESNGEVNPHSSSVTIHETNPESEKDNSGSDNTSIALVRIETIRLLIALAAGKGWKIHHLDVKTAFLNCDRKKLDRTSLDCINEFKRRMASQFEMSNLGELTYYLGIEISQGKDYVEIKQERYPMKISKVARMEDCNPALCPMEPGLKLSKAKDEPEGNNDMRLVGYSSHNVDIDDERSTTGHVFYLGTSHITWCSQKETTTALSSCEAEFMAAIAAACQAIWLREVLTKVMENEQVIVEHVSGENQRADSLTKALARIRFKEMRSLLGVQELPSSTQKFKGSERLSPVLKAWRFIRTCQVTSSDYCHKGKASVSRIGFDLKTKFWRESEYRDSGM
ncbi:uncharacterized mitochondrial protein-like protein [Tanacetum coccineum]